MTFIYHVCYVVGLIRAPERWVNPLLTVVLLAGLSAFALAVGNEAAASYEQAAQQDVAQHDYESLTEANGSIDPFAPFHGEGDMIEQTAVLSYQLYGNGPASGACILPVYCW
ncbi:MAG: hypothetical protein F4Y11_09290 [Chloroflexi bacterium]|nr:hypothetical protein [Chloroflexota bacterium]